MTEDDSAAKNNENEGNGSCGDWWNDGNVSADNDNEGKSYLSTDGEQPRSPYYKSESESQVLEADRVVNGLPGICS